MDKGKYNIAHNRVLDSISEGILLIGFNGVVILANETAVRVLGYSKEELTGSRISDLFFERSENEAFSQIILDAAYDKENTHSAVVPYVSDKAEYILRVVTSFYSDGGERTGIIVAFSDLSELFELRDAVKSMRRIQELNYRLELRNKLLNETFGRFLSDDIVKELLDTPDGLKLGGEKRTLSIMMSDLRGFTALSEGLDPSELITLLNHYLGEMTDPIQKYGGTIIEFIGDGILAVFGAPYPMEDHASRAVAAALEMQIKMAEINSWNKERGFPPLEMGIGINTGEVIVGNLGSDKRMKYGVAGKEVNLCGRIESYTVGGQILIPPATASAIKEELETAKKMTVYPKGVKGELVLSQITGIGAPYNLSLKLESARPEPLKKPVPVCFYRLEGKHKEGKALFGGLTATADDRGILETGTTLNVLDNIQLNAGGDLYCKVLEELDNGYLIQYTAIPANFMEWIKSFM